MATRSFLTETQITTAKKLLKSEGAIPLSLWLGETLEKRLSAHPEWQASRPYRLGSWARGELCAKSDIDLLFVGEEKKVKILVNDFLSEGIKIRYRAPADLSDWTKNVEPFDILALLSAVPFFSEDLEALVKQQRLIYERGVKYKKELFKAMLAERKERTKRYDSIANYLEPNLKYGPGGLRDLEQGLMIHLLFSEIINRGDEISEKIKANKIQLLAIRHYLHLHGSGDILSSNIQNELAQFFDFTSSQKMMSELEAKLSDISFYADWMAEAARTSRIKRIEIDNTTINNFAEALQALKKNSSILMQEKVRQAQLGQAQIEKKTHKQLGRAFEKYFNVNMSDNFVQALFKSQILHKTIFDLKRLKGYVQHDQYHRYSVDAHTLQAVREVLRAKNKSKILGRLSTLARGLSAEEWGVLLWTALYHDLGKGLKGDHSSEGSAIAKRDLINMGVSLSLTSQVAWMVKNHLILSAAAFRQNPQDPNTWLELFRRGVKNRRIAKLAIFTAIDIRATNPDAWNDWKERLLASLCDALQSPQANKLSEFLEFAEKKRVKVDKIFIENLDAQVIENLPRQKLLADYKRLEHAKGNLAPLAVRNRKKEMWVRLHRKSDSSGLFLAFAGLLHYAGLNVQEAFIQTYADYGAYDWFKVRTTKSESYLNNILKKNTVTLEQAISITENELSAVKFSVIDVVAQNERSAILSFRGRDQRGALLAAAKALYQAGFEIQSAKVHTWGRQIDDVFTVSMRHDFSDALNNLTANIL